MKKILATLTLIAILSISGCTGQTTTDTPTPTLKTIEGYVTVNGHLPTNHERVGIFPVGGGGVDVSINSSTGYYNATQKTGYDTFIIKITDKDSYGEPIYQSEPMPFTGEMVNITITR